MCKYDYVIDETLVTPVTKTYCRLQDVVCLSVAMQATVWPFLPLSGLVLE